MSNKFDSEKFSQYHSSSKDTLKKTLKYLSTIDEFHPDEIEEILVKMARTKDLPKIWKKVLDLIKKYCDEDPNKEFIYYKLDGYIENFDKYYKSLLSMQNITLLDAYYYTDDKYDIKINFHNIA